MSGKKRKKAVQLLVNEETQKWREIKKLLLELTNNQREKFKDALTRSKHEDRKDTLIMIAAIVIFFLVVPLFPV